MNRNTELKKKLKKRCNMCGHLIYAYIQSVNKYGYKCEETGNRRSYLAFKPSKCNDFKNKY